MYLLYSLKDGSIQRFSSNEFHPYDYDEKVSAQKKVAGEGGFELASTHRIDLRTRTLVRKQRLPVDDTEGIADGSTETRFKHLPEGTLVDELVINDGILELTFDTPGEHEVTFRHPAYLDTTITVTIREP